MEGEAEVVVGGKVLEETDSGVEEREGGERENRDGAEGGERGRGGEGVDGADEEHPEAEDGVGEQLRHGRRGRNPTFRGRKRERSRRGEKR